VPTFALFLAVKPFFPVVASADRVMVKRWMDYSDDEKEDEDFDEVVTREVGAAPSCPTSTPSAALLRLRCRFSTPLWCSLLVVRGAPQPLSSPVAEPAKEA
jgi:hypothetical protein